jgi:O-antigen/teichoic acid export membrane protein
MISLTKGIFSTLFTRGLVALLGLAVVVITSRYLGAEGRGVISLMMSLIAFLQLFCDFGSNSALINLSYHIPQRRLWLSSILWVFITCILAYVPALMFTHIRYILFVPLAAFLYSFVNINSLLLMGNRRVSRRNLVMLVTPVLLLAGFASLFFFTDTGADAYPLSLLISLIISGLISWLMLRDKLSPVQEQFRFERQVISHGFWVQGGHAIQFLNYRLNFFLVVYLLNEASLGIYNNVIVLAEAVWILGHSMGQMQHMKILNTSDITLHVGLTNKFIRINFIGSLGLMLVLVFIPDVFWTWIFSDDFSGMGHLLVYLLPGVLSFSLSNIINHFLHAKNQFRSIMLANIAGLLTGLTGSVFLIPAKGLEGACTAWSIGFTSAMITYLFIYKRYLKNN